MINAAVVNRGDIAGASWLPAPVIAGMERLVQTQLPTTSPHGPSINNDKLSAESYGENLIVRLNSNPMSANRFENLSPASDTTTLPRECEATPI